MTEQYEELLNSCVKCLRTYKKLIESQLEGDELEECNDALNDITKTYCKMDVEHSQSQSAMNKTIDYFSADNNDYTKQVDKVYQDFLSEESKEVKEYTEHSIWKRLNRETKSNETVADGDCSVLVSQAFKPPLDPITKKVILDPCKNKVCGHTYDYETIVSYMRASKTQTRCPYIGCNNVNMHVEFLEKDPLLRDDIEDYLKSHS